MKKNTLNFWVDTALLTLMLALVFTGLLIYYVLPPCGNCAEASCPSESSSSCASCPGESSSSCGSSAVASCPSGGGAEVKGEPTLWGFNRHDYGDAHFMIALALLALTLLHAILHWSWICVTMGTLLNVKADKTGRNSLYGIMLLIVLIALTVGAIFWLKTQVQF